MDQLSDEKRILKKVLEREPTAELTGKNEAEDRENDYCNVIKKRTGVVESKDKEEEYLVDFGLWI